MIPSLSSFTYQPHHVHAHSQSSIPLPFPIAHPQYDSKVAHVILLSVFGFDSFRGGQEDSIRASLRGEDALVVMATGAGKSLCYFFPTIYIREFEAAKKALAETPSENVREAAALHKRSITSTSNIGGFTIVISPLISLMRDQVRALNDSTIIRAVSFDSTTQNPLNVLNRINNGEFHIILTSPESISYVVKNIRRTVHLIAIDEAHCISEWGANFRREYQTLGLLRPLFPGVPFVALTATATDRVRLDICKNLELVNPIVLVASFDRPNLRYEVSLKSTIKSDIGYVLDTIKGGGSIIIYTMSKNESERVCREINEAEFSFTTTSSSSSSSPSVQGPLSTSPSRRADFYHGSRSTSDKKRIQDEFMNGAIQIIVATTAFGMGINKPDVRAVVHYGMPLSLENYFQQTGRAGRDGKPSLCVLFWAKYDFRILRLLHISQETIDSIQRYCVDKSSCRRRRLLNYFDEKIMQSNVCEHEKCDVCLPTVRAMLPAHMTSPSKSTLSDVSSPSLHTKPALNMLTGGFSGSDFLADLNNKNESDDEIQADDDLNADEDEVDDVQRHYASEDAGGILARIGSWNLRATSRILPECLEEKVACLIFRASAEGWTVFVLQECSSQGVGVLIGLFQRCEYFHGWSFCYAETRNGEVALTAYDTSIWRRLDLNDDNQPPLTYTSSDDSEGFYRKPCLVFLCSKDIAENDLILAVVNVHLLERSTSNDDRTLNEARRLASDIVPWVEQEALRVSGSKNFINPSSSASSSNIEIVTIQNLSILIIGDTNLAPPGSFLDDMTHPKNSWDNIISAGFKCVLPSGGSGRPGVPTNILVSPSSKPRELDNAFFRKSTWSSLSSSTSSSASSSSSSASFSSSSIRSSSELTAIGVVHELPHDQFNSWRLAQSNADAQLETLLQHLGVPPTGSVSLERAVAKQVKRAARLSFLDSFSDHKMLSVTIKRVTTPQTSEAPTKGNNDIVRKEKAKRVLELASFLKAASVLTKAVDREFSAMKKDFKATEGEQEWAHYIEGSGTLSCKALNRKDYSAVPEHFVTMKKMQFVTAKLEEGIERKGMFEFRRACGKEYEKGDVVEDKNEVGKKRQRG
jgi:superfamily II DNA helicase RecQ